MPFISVCEEMKFQDCLDRAIPHLACPAHPHQAGVRLRKKNETALECTACGRIYPVTDGVIDFIPDYDRLRRPGAAQRFMENKAIVAVYEKYFRPAFTRLGSSITYAEEIRWLESVVSDRPVRTVLDLASGTGKYARLLNRIYHPEIVFAVDISLAMLKKSIAVAMGKGVDNIIHIRADAGALPFYDRSIQRVNCFGALHLFPDVERVFMELSRTVEDRTLFTCLTSRRLKRRFSPQPLFSRLFSFRFFDEDQLEKDLKTAGFVDMTRIGRNMVLLFSCRKKAGHGVESSV